MSVVEEGQVRGASIVFDHPLPFREGQRVTVHIETASPASTTETTAPPDSARPSDLSDLPFFGQWADRTDLPESDTLVRQERQKWQQRTSRTD